MQYACSGISIPSGGSTDGDQLWGLDLKLNRRDSQV